MSKQNTGIKKFDTGRFDFLKLSLPFGGLSLIAVAVSLLLILFKGFNFGIDFVGGNEVQVLFNQAIDIAELRKVADGFGLKNASVQSFGGSSEFLLRFEVATGKSEREINDNNNAMVKKVTQGVVAAFSAQGAEIRRIDSVGPQVGSELKRNGLLAMFYCLVVILIYVGLRFDFAFSPAAVLCLFHDAIVTLGIYSLLHKEVNVQTLAAVMTIIGYSLNDTIIIFDRVRENLGLFKDVPLAKIMNRSVNETLSRTILTSFATLLAVLSLYFIGGGVIKDFAFTMLIGVIIGSYSTIYVAFPLVMMTKKLFFDFEKKAA